MTTFFIFHHCKCKRSQAVACLGVYISAFIYKVKREEVVETVLKQKELVKELQTEIKQLKRSVWKSQLPTWIQQTELIKDVPFLCINIKNSSSEELRDISQSLAEKQPGFYFLISSIGDRSIFLGHLSSEFSDRLNLKNFGAWLKDEHALRGGGAKNTIQGGGGNFDAKIDESIKSWLNKNISE
jgi:alanyl-tRNA synthetase